MRLTVRLLIAIFAGAICAQMPAQVPTPSTPPANIVWFCPMDKDIRSNQEGYCSRCGMKLVSGLPEPVAYHLDLSVTPRPPKVGEKAHLQFSIHDPWKNLPVKTFQLVHEKLLHMFVINENLQVFVHDHPTLGIDGDFHYDLRFPDGGMYRVLADFYPEGATPQLIPTTVIVPGPAPKPAVLTRDYSAKDAENMQVGLVTEPPQPIAGDKTQLRLTIKPGDGIERYLGAWGHALAASDDLIDLIHEHPFIADGGPNIQFNIVFPRARMYRVWVQFQRKGVVNTVHFDIPVNAL
jgi:hypothetical protein